MAEKLLTGLVQISIITETFDTTLRNLEKNFRICPWKCWDYKPPYIFDTHRNGKPIDWTFKVAVTWVGDVQLEVIQPGIGPTIYQDYLDHQGEGVHHIMVNTRAGYKKTGAAFEKAGYPSIQGATISAPLQVGQVTLPRLPAFLNRHLSLQFAFHDTFEDLGTILEIYKLPPGFSYANSMKLGKPDYTVDPSTPPDEAGPLVQSIDRIGILVPDLEISRAKWEALGVGPWQNGDNQEAMRATAKLDDINIDLIQPGESDLYRSLYDTHGPGIQYLGVKTSTDAIERFAEVGCGVLEHTEAGAFIDARHLAHTVFLVQE